MTNTLMQAEDISLIKQKFIDLWERKKHFYNNFFVPDKTLLRWFQKKTLHYIYTDDSLLVLHKHQDFAQVYISTINISDAELLLKALRSQIHIPLSTDIIGDDINLSSLLESVGFKHEVTLQRMTRTNATNPNNYQPSENIFHANNEEIDLLLSLFSKDFNPLTKHLPDKDELRDLIKEDNVMVTRTENGEISAYMVKEQHGVVSLLRFISVLPTHRRRGLGKILLNEFLNHNTSIKKHILWVKTNNIAAIELYKQHNFICDGLYDKIYIMEADRQNNAF